MAKPPKKKVDDIDVQNNAGYVPGKLTESYHWVDTIFSRVRKSGRSRREPDKYKDFEATGVGKGKQREGQESGQVRAREMKKRGGKK